MRYILSFAACLAYFWCVQANAMYKDSYAHCVHFIIADFIEHHDRQENNTWTCNHKTNCLEHCCTYQINTALILYDTLQKIKSEAQAE
jgi:hypothetical protein